MDLEGCEMTKDEIIKMAREANLPSCLATHPKALERFAKLVAEKEREECAQTVLNIAGFKEYEFAANSIRARGQE